MSDVKSADSHFEVSQIQIETRESAIERLVKSSTVRRLLLKEYPRCKVYRGTIADIAPSFFDAHPKYSQWSEYDPESEIWIVEDRARKEVLHIEEYKPKDIEIDANVWPFIMLKWLLNCIIIILIFYIFLTN
jgi:hypothetical protein